MRIKAISKKGKDRIGKQWTEVVVEQDRIDRLFISIPSSNQWRWIKKTNDPDFIIEP